MNKENAHLYLPLVQALADGKTIQIKVTHEAWGDRPECKFSSPPDEYRIKPEPLVVYARIYEGGNVGVGHTTRKAAEESATGWIRIARFVESEDQS